MASSEFYSAAAQLIPALLLAVLLQLRYGMPLTRRLFDILIKTTILYEVRQQRARQDEERPCGAADTDPIRHAHSRSERSKLAKARRDYRVIDQGSRLTPDEYADVAFRVEYAHLDDEITYHGRAGGWTRLLMVAPVLLSLLSIIASLIALSLDTPPGWIALFVWPGIIATVVPLATLLHRMLSVQATIARLAAEDYIVESGTLDKIWTQPPGGPGSDGWSECTSALRIEEAKRQEKHLSKYSLREP
jgi:hypothetical protein